MRIKFPPKSHQPEFTALICLKERYNELYKGIKMLHEYLLNVDFYGYQENSTQRVPAVSLLGHSTIKHCNGHSEHISKENTFTFKHFC